MTFSIGDFVRIEDSEHPEVQGQFAQIVKTAPSHVSVTHDGTEYAIPVTSCKPSFVVVGLDEVGRGAFSGPLVVVAAAFRVVGLVTDEQLYESAQCPVPNIKDSKKYTTSEKREAAEKVLQDYPGLVATGFGEISHAEINRHGMAWAMRTAIQNAITAVREKVIPDVVLLDGNEKAPGWTGMQRSKPKADDLWWPVSAASVIAKVYRDRLMVAYDKVYPGYGFARNRGYGSQEHRDALRKLGPCPIHRTSFIRSTMEAT